MTEYKIETHGLQELLARMRAFPQKLRQVQEIGMNASLNVLWENVPSYPPPPETSTYRRTGTLGRTLGSSQSGGKSGGKPEIFEVKGLGTNAVEGRFGTNLEYAPYVIGENQARHMAHWWKLSSILPKAQDKIKAIWEGIAKKLADYLNSKGVL